jgi:hypothetical protein
MTTPRHLAWTASALAALATTFAAHPAHACTTKGSGHYYVIQYDQTNDADHGARLALRTDNLTDSTPSSSFVDHEMWYGVNASGSHWVEVGVTDGETISGTAVNQHVFWADNRGGGGGYHEHYPNVSWKLGPYYQVMVQWAGNNAWNVYFGTIHLGTSTNNFDGGATRLLEAGIEAVHARSGDHVGGYINHPERKDANDHWYNGWQNPAFLEDCPGDMKRTDSLTTHEVLHGPA